MTGSRSGRRIVGALLVGAALAGCSLFSESSSSTTTTTKPKGEPTTTASTDPTATTQPPGTAGADALKPVLNELVGSEARLNDELVANKGAALRDPESPQRAAFIDLYAPGSKWPEELLDELAAPLDDNVYLQPMPGEARATWGWVVDVIPRPNGGAPNEVEFTACVERKAVVVDDSGNQVDEVVGVLAGRFKARRYDGIWRLHSPIGEADPAICMGGHPT